jgi:hypothetical protein
MKTQSPWLTGFLDLLTCPYCRSGEVMPVARMYGLNVQWCRCEECVREFKVSKKRWTRYDRQARGAGAALARDLKRQHPEDPEKRSAAVRNWGGWVCSIGMPKAVWTIVSAVAVEILAADAGNASPSRQEAA